MKINNLQSKSGMGKEESEDIAMMTSRRGALRMGAAGFVGIGSMGKLRDVQSSTAPAEQVITFESLTGEKVPYYIGVSGSLEKTTAYGANQNPSDELVNDGSAASGFVIGGRDSYRYTGEITDIGSNGDLAVLINGQRTDPSELLDYTVTVEAAEGSKCRYALLIDGYFVKSTGYGGTINANDEISSYEARGRVVNGGRDSYSTNSTVTSLILNGDGRALLNGSVIDPSKLTEATNGDGGGEGTDELKLGYDQRERLWSRGEVFETFEDFSRGWQPINYETTLRSDINERFRDEGVGSARLDGDSNTTRLGMELPMEGGRSFEGQDISMAVKIDGTEYETLTVELLAPNEKNKIVYKQYVGRADGWVRLDLGEEAVVGSPDLSNVQNMRISAYTGGTPMSIYIDEIRTLPSRNGGAVVLTFDDNHVTQYETFREMNSRGMAGTVGVIHDIVGEDDRLSLDQMNEMQQAGWTMASHPQKEGEKLGEISREKAETMMRATKQWLVDNGFENGARCLIWPFGSHDHDSLELAGEYHELSFGGGFSTGAGRLTEASWVQRVNGDDVENALAAIEHAEKYNSVATLMFHTIGTNRLSMADFRSLLDAIESRDLDVLTASQFADEQRVAKTQ